MNTRSLIGIKEGDMVKTISCHWDGQPKHNGKTLVENYTSPSKIYELLALGNLSTLKETIESCWAYHRDRNEPMVHAKDIKYSELMYIVTNADNYNISYIYIYNDECEWECFKYDGTPVDILSELALN